MNDGAQMGIGAERALETILGGKPAPESAERMTTAQLRDMLLSAEPDPQTYNDCANYCGRLFLEFLLAHPGAGGDSADELYAATKAAGAPLKELGLTGFQVGWAANAARACVELPAVPNPAIMVIET